MVWHLCVQDVIEIMREGMFDRAPLSGLAGGVPVLDFRKAPGSRGGKAGEAARFIAALRTMGTQQNRDTFSTAELQVCVVIDLRGLGVMSCVSCQQHATHMTPRYVLKIMLLLPSQAQAGGHKVSRILKAMYPICVFATQDVVKQLQLNARDPRAFIDQLNEAGERKDSAATCLPNTCILEARHVASRFQ